MLSPLRQPRLHSACSMRHKNHRETRRTAHRPAGTRNSPALRILRGYETAAGTRLRRVIMDLVTEFLTGYVVPAGTGVAGVPGLKASRRSTGGALSVFETSIEAGPPLHVHDREDECFYILDGELSVRCGGEVFDAGAGSFVFLPRGRPHRFWAPARPARLLLIVAPGGIEDYFAEINSASTDDERHRIGERFGIRVVTG
jgi:mannose-6-phosphate isomerase-like protein (cupin superfamily)